MATDDDPPRDEAVLDPWGSGTVEDYRELFDRFGIEAFAEIRDDVPDAHHLMRRGAIFGHREYERVLRAMAGDEPFAALSGFMPTGEPHIGHMMVFQELVWHQRQGGSVYGLVADLEAHSARGMSWAAIDRYARDYVLSFLAAGFDPEVGTLYRQSSNREVQDLAFELGIEANFSELQAIYGFDGETDVSHMQSVVTQAADILYPQFCEKPMPTVIPVGPDQDPHVRLTRDLAARTRFFGVTEAYASFELDDEERPIVAEAYDRLLELLPDPADVRCVDAARLLDEGSESVDPNDRDLDSIPVSAGTVPKPEREAINKLYNAGKEPLHPRTRIFVRKAPDAAFEALLEAVPGEKRVFDAHVDCFDLDPTAARDLAREVELAHGGFGFEAPSSVYHQFMTGLTGGKMSSSVPASHISLLDDPDDAADKVEAATTGGRETAELQRELGGRADECPVYELYAYLLAGDDDELAETVYDECVGGERLCGPCKAQAADLMREFLEEHQAGREAWADRLDELDIGFESDRPGRRP
ncbi:MAG: tryptophan--tRNA ligase [Halobacteriota archaeon]